MSDHKAKLKSVKTLNIGSPQEMFRNVPEIPTGQLMVLLIIGAAEMEKRQGGTLLDKLKASLEGKEEGCNCGGCRSNAAAREAAKEHTDSVVLNEVGEA